ncbi:MAG TPA: lipid-A-disaccharide synthase [Fimbriiglobus sp.]|nr:lipid-A-disaccharide synthase [Fimbriiglobus sp.]
MHLFISAGEPSGDLHGANLIRALGDRQPGLRVTGLGGDRMRAAGADLVFPLADMAAMWVGRVVRNLPTYFKVLRQSDIRIRSDRPDAVVLIDCPGFNWHIAKAAHRAGVPVYYFVPPQLWAWAGWRVSKMQRWVRTVMTALPFEDGWYRDRGVETHYIGHPYFDEIAEQVVDREFVAVQRRAGGPVVALLPGSRNQEVTANFPLMLAAAERVRSAVPAARFLVASFKESQARTARDLLAGTGLPAEVHVGRTPEIIESADACIAVSGSVGLELMTRLKPTVVVYKVAPFARWVSRQFITCRYISLVNLLADTEVFPEYLTTRENPDEVAGHVIGWLTRPSAREAVVTTLRQLCDRAAVPGACERAADFLLDDLSARGRKPVSRVA